jgi:glycosyltransferase involved in cell wall biosynthesis
MRIAVVLNTYQKPNGKTPELLTRAINSIKNQTYKNWVLILVGDNYEDKKEFDLFERLVSDKSKIMAQNLPFAPEREKYLNVNNTALWNCGGISARNYGIEIVKILGIEYYCNLDHDDYWAADHLENIINVIKANNKPAFIHTLSTYKQIDYFPTTYLPDGNVIEKLPVPAGLIHSSTCININQLPFRYIDCFDKFNKIYPSDAYMWEVMSKEITDKNLKSLLIKKVTCFHETEGE